MTKIPITNHLQSNLERTKKLAISLGKNAINPDLVLYTLLTFPSLGCSAIWDHCGLDIEGLQSAVTDEINSKKPAKSPSDHFAPKTKLLFSIAENLCAGSFGIDYLAPEVLFLCFFSEDFAPKSFKKFFNKPSMEEVTDMDEVKKLFESTALYLRDYDFEERGEAEEDFSEEGNLSENCLDMFDENKILSQFAENLNLKAAKGQFESIVDFDNKIDELTAILCRKKKPNAILVGPAGCGKCLGKGTKVLMFDGSFKNVEDIVVGDLVMGADSSPRTVLSLGRGRDKMYKIKQVKGIDYTVNSEHILSLRSGSTGDVVNLSVQEYLKKNTTFKQEYKGWKTGVDFPERELPVDPYLLGLYLGDGTVGNPEITNTDPEIVEFIKKYQIENDLSTAFRDGKTYSLFGNGPYTVHQILDNKIVNSFKSTSEAARHLRTNENMVDENYLAHSRINSADKYNKEAYGFYWKRVKRKTSFPEYWRETNFRELGKFIPEDFKINSRENRLELLAGILDTDGYLTQNCYDIVQKNKKLAEDIMFLARSLGLGAHCREKVATMRRKDGSMYSCLVYRMSISGHTDQIPCRVARRKASSRKQIKNVLHTGITIEELGEDDYYGFTLDGNHLFLLEDFTVTHNTSLLESLALNIVRGEAPELLSNKVIYSLNLSGMVAGTMYRGQFEERLKNFVDEVKKYNNIILFIDEIHTLIGAGGGSSSSLEASNILKPELARGTISCIGATTINEYTETIKKDSALDRRFERVVVREPSKFIMRQILPEIISHYEDFHGVKYSQEFVDNVVEFCERFLPNRFYPDKAVTVIDHCGAQAKVNFWQTDDSVKESHQKILAQIDGEEDIPAELFEELNSRLELWQARVMEEEPVVELDHLKDFFEKKKNPLASFSTCSKIAQFMKKEFVGQKPAIRDFFETLNKVSMGLGKKNSASAPDSYLFYGRKSSGKTLFSRKLKDALEKNGASVLYYSGIQLADSYAPYKILSDYGKNTTLCEKIVMNPNSVVIIDDFGDIHFSCVDLFSQILKEGKLQMSNGEIADFSNCKFIFTCKQEQSSTMGFNSDKEQSGPELNAKLKGLVEKSFLLSNPTQRDLRRIVYNKLKEIKSNLLFQDIEFCFDFKFIKGFVGKNKCEEDCVSIINEAIERDLVPIISEKALKGEKVALLG